MCKISFFIPNLVAFISQKDKNVWFFNYHLLTCSVRKMKKIKISVCCECLPCNKKMLLNLVEKKWIFTNTFVSLSSFLWLYYSGFMHNLIKFELCHAVEAILSTMLLLKLVAEKSATTFGDLPDCLGPQQPLQTEWLEDHLEGLIPCPWTWWDPQQSIETPPR